MPGLVDKEEMLQLDTKQLTNKLKKHETLKYFNNPQEIANRVVKALSDKELVTKKQKEAGRLAIRNKFFSNDGMKVNNKLVENVLKTYEDSTIKLSGSLVKLFNTQEYFNNIPSTHSKQIQRALEGLDVYAITLVDDLVLLYVPVVGGIWKPYHLVNLQVEDEESENIAYTVQTKVEAWLGCGNKKEVILTGPRGGTLDLGYYLSEEKSKQSTIPLSNGYKLTVE